MVKIIDSPINLAKKWSAEVDIFNDIKGELGKTDWKLDFACDEGFAVEVAFNHGEAIAWNLIKPCLASELNHVEKASQTRLGIYVCATDDMKVCGNFDSATGSFEKVNRYLTPMMAQLITPMMIIGLEAPESFHINPESLEVVKGKNEKYILKKEMDKIKEFLDERTIEYTTGTSATFNKQSVKIALKVQTEKIAFLKPEHTSKRLILENGGWKVYELVDSSSVDTCLAQLQLSKNV